MENAASRPYATIPRLPKKSLTLTDAGIRSGLSSSMNGTEEFPHIITNEETVTTATPGDHGRLTVALSVPEALPVAGLASRVARCVRAV